MRALPAVGNLTKILYVDDEANITAAFKRQFKEKYDVYLANSGSDALALLEEHDDLQVIIVDHNMPHMTGTTFLEKARRISSLAVFIMLTGETDKDVVVEALHKGEIYRFLNKPCSFEVLEKSIDDGIARYVVTELKEKLALTAKELQETNNQLESKVVQLRELNYQLELEQAENESEMKIAKEVFDRLIYTHTKDAYYLKSWMSPMSIFSGDLILSAQSRSNHTYVMLADFTGHGLPAAIGAPLVANIFMTKAKLGESLPEIIAELNRSLNVVLPTNLFCAACLLEYEYQSQKVTIWNGGLPDVLIINADGSIKTKIPSSHLPLGINRYSSKDLICETYDVELNNTAFIYSDGLTDACDSSGEMYGTERLEQSFIKSENQQAPVHVVKDRLEEYIGDTKQNDDISIVTINFDEIKPVDLGTIVLSANSI
jgi:two-component system, HptB-dependent secretion and biofilm response regulator